MNKVGGQATSRLYGVDQKKNLFLADTQFMDHLMFGGVHAVVPPQFWVYACIGQGETPPVADLW